MIERQKNEYVRTLKFRLPRAELDRIAAEAIAFYEACGYSQTEIRPRDKDVESIQMMAANDTNPESLKEIEVPQ